MAIDKDNLIVVQRYGPLNFAVTERNLRRVKSEVDRVFSQAAAEPASSEPVDVGGFPALEFDEIELMRPPDGVSRIVVLFDQRTEYVINCQSTPEHRDEIEEACEVALDSLEPKS